MEKRIALARLFFSTDRGFATVIPARPASSVSVMPRSASSLSRRRATRCSVPLGSASICQMSPSASLVRSLAASEITLLTVETGQAFRARNAGLNVRKLSKPPGLARPQVQRPRQLDPRRTQSVPSRWPARHSTGLREPHARRHARRWPCHLTTVQLPRHPRPRTDHSDLGATVTPDRRHAGAATGREVPCRPRQEVRAAWQDQARPQDGRALG